MVLFQRDTCLAHHIAPLLHFPPDMLGKSLRQFTGDRVGAQLFELLDHFLLLRPFDELAMQTGFPLLYDRANCNSPRAGINCSFRNSSSLVTPSSAMSR